MGLQAFLPERKDKGKRFRLHSFCEAMGIMLNAHNQTS